jgi:hypothetical protein
MGQFIKLPKSKTDLTSFDLMNVAPGISGVITSTATVITVEVMGRMIPDGEQFPFYQVTVSPAMTDTQQLDMIQNMSQAVQDSTQDPNSIPSLSMVGNVLVTELVYKVKT